VEFIIVNENRIQTLTFDDVFFCLITCYAAVWQVPGLCKGMETSYCEMCSKYSYNCLEKISGLSNLFYRLCVQTSDALGCLYFRFQSYF